MRFLALVSNGERLAELSEKAANSQDAATLQVLKTMDSIEAKSQQLKTSLQSLYTSTGVQNLFKGILDYGNGIITTFTKMPTVFNLPIVAIAKFGTQFFTLANVVTNAFGLIKARLTSQSKILQGQMTADAKMGETARVQISQEEMAELQAILEQGPEARVKLEERMTQIARKGANDRTNIAKGEASGISKAMATSGLIASAAGSALSMISAGMKEDTQQQRTTKGLTDLAGTALSSLGTGLMIGGPAGAVVGALTALPGLITGISTMIETAAEREERLKKAVEETNNVYLQRKDEAKTLEEQIDKLEELEKAQYDSAEAKQEFIELSNQIAEQHPGLITGFDLEGNALIDLTSSYYALKKAREAANDAAKETAKASVEQADNDIKIAEENRNKVFDEYRNKISGEYNSSKADELIQFAKNYGIEFEDENWVKEILSEIDTDPAAMLTQLEYSFPEQIEKLKEAYRKNDQELSIVLGDIIDSTNNISNISDSNKISSLIKDKESNEYGLMTFIESILLDEDGSIDDVVNLVNENKELINNIRKEIIENNGEDNWAVKFLESFLDINGEATQAIADVEKVAQMRTSLVKSQLSSISSSTLNMQQNDFGNAYLKEMEAVNNYVTQYLVQKQKEAENIEGEGHLSFDDYLDKQLNEDLVDVQDFLQKFWTTYLNTESERNKFNQLMQNAKQYSSDQMEEELLKLAPQLTSEELNTFIVSIYGEELDTISNNFKQSVEKRFSEQTKQLYSVLENINTDEMGQADLSAILEVYDKLATMVSSGAMTDSAAKVLFEQYNRLWEISKGIENSVDREQVQGLLQNVDLTSLESIASLLTNLDSLEVNEETKKQINQLITNGQLLKSLIPINLNTEIESFIESVTTGMEDFEKALDKATKGMSYKDATEIAAKMDVSVSDFRQVGNKFFIDDLNALRDAYIKIDKNLLNVVQNRVNSLETSLNQVFGDNFEIDAVTPEFFNQSNIKNLLSNVFQKNNLNLDIDSLNISAKYEEWSKINQETRGKFVDYIIQSLTKDVEEAKKIEELVNTQIAEGYLARGQISDFIKNLNLKYTDKQLAIWALQNNELEVLFDIIPEYAEQLMNGLNKVHSDFLKRIQSESSYDNYIKVDPDNINIANQYIEKDWAEGIYDGEELIGIKLKEVTSKNINQFRQFVNNLDIPTDDKIKQAVDATKSLYDDTLDEIIINIVKNFDAVSIETVETLRQYLIKEYKDENKVNELIDSLFTLDGESYKTNKVSFIPFFLNLGKKINEKTRKIGSEAIEKSVDDILKEISSTTDLLSKGTTSTEQAQKFIDNFKELTGKELSIDEAFNYDELTKSLVLNPEVVKEYIETKKDELKKLGKWNEDTEKLLEAQTQQQLASMVDIQAFLNAENNEEGSEARKTLEAQMRNYYATLGITGEEADKAINEWIKIILEGGIFGAKAISYWAERAGKEASSKDTEAGYLAEVAKLENAFDQLSYNVGAIVNEKAHEILKEADYTFTDLGNGSYRIETVGNVNKAYQEYYNQLEETGEATIAALNEAKAKTLETKDDTTVVIEALGDAANMTITYLYTLFSDKGKKLTDEVYKEWIDSGAIEDLGGGKLKVNNIKDILDELGYTYDESSEEFISAYKKFNDALIESNRKIEKNILEEIESIKGLNPGDQVNITQLVSELDEITIAKLTGKLALVGATLSDGILTLEKDANILGIAQTLAREAQENGLLLQDSMAELADTVEGILSDYTDKINAGIEGKLSNVEAQSLQVQAQNLGYLGKLDFTKTAEGLKLSKDSAISLYNHLKEIDKLQAELVFDTLYDSIIDSTKKLDTMSGTLSEITKIQKKIEDNEKEISKYRAKKDNTRVQQIEEENKKLKEQLDIYDQIKNRQLGTPESFDFMGQSLPDAFNGAENYWNSWGSAFKAMNEAGETGRMSMTDFYNIVQEMQNLAVLSGQDLTFMGQKLYKDGTGAADLIQKGFNALTNVDGEGVAVNLKEFGNMYAKGAAGMQSGAQEGIKAMAKTQIAILDAQILLLETIVAMQKIGELDIDNSGFIDFGELYKWDENGYSYTEKAQEFVDEIIALADKNPEIQTAFESLYLGQYSFWDLLNNKSNELTKLGESGRLAYLKAFNEIKELVESDEFDPEHVQESVQKIIDNSGLKDIFAMNYYDKSANISIVSKPFVGSFTIDWSELTPEKLKALGFSGKNMEEQARELLDKYVQDKPLNPVETFQSLSLLGKIKVVKDGKVTKYEYNGKKFTKSQLIAEIKKAQKAGLDFGTAEYDAGTDTLIYKKNISGINTKVSINKNGTKHYDFGDFECDAKDEDDAWKKYYETKRKVSEGKKGHTYETEEEFFARINATVNNQVTVTGDLSTEKTKQEARKLLSKSKEAFQKDIDEANKGKGSDEPITVPVGDATYTFPPGTSIETIANKIMEDTGLGDSTLINNIAKGIQSAFTNDSDNSIGKAIVTGIVTALADSELLADKQFTIPEVTATITKLTITEALDVAFGNAGGLGGFVKGALKNITGSEDLVIPEATAKVNKLTLTDADEVDATTVGEKIATEIENYFKENPIVINAELGNVGGTNSNSDSDSNSDNSSSSIFEGIANKFKDIGEASKSITADKVKAIQEEQNKIETTKVRAIQEEQNKIDSNKVVAIQNAQEAIRNDKVMAIQQAQSQIRSDRVEAIKDAAALVDASHVRAIKIEADLISTSRIEAVKRAINNLSGSVSLGVDIAVSVSSSGTGQAKGHLGKWSSSYEHGHTSGMTLHTSTSNAYARGKDTLMGELGPELVVSNGRYFLVGQNGPEMVDLAEDAIVFNHLQTKKLIEQGKVNTHGKPITNERNAVSMATGNFSGPAMASAQEILDLLKQLRAMWESLLNASYKDLGGIAGLDKDDDKDKTDKPDKDTDDIEEEDKYVAGIVSKVERWYNWLRAIEKTQQDINKLTKEYTLLEKQGASEAAKISNLEEQYAKHREEKAIRDDLIEEQTEARDKLAKSIQDGNNALSAFYQIADNGELMLARDKDFQDFVKSQGGSLSFTAQRQHALSADEAKRLNQINEDWNEAHKDDKDFKARKTDYEQGAVAPEDLTEEEKFAIGLGTLDLGTGLIQTASDSVNVSISSGLDLMKELQKEDQYGNLIYSAEQQFDILKQLGLEKFALTKADGSEIDTTKEGWEQEAMQNFYSQIDGAKEEWDSLTNSINEQQQAALDDEVAMAEINRQILDMVKPVRGITESLEKWYNETKKIEYEMEKINKLTAEQNNLQKDRIINGKAIYKNIKEQEESLKNQKALNEDLLKKRRQEQQERQDKYSNLPIDVDPETGVATFSEKKFGNKFKNIQTTTTREVRNEQGYVVDENDQYVDSNGVLRDKNGNEVKDGKFGKVKTETVTQDFNASGKTLPEVLEALAATDANGKPLWDADQTYQILQSLGYGEYLQYDENGNKIQDFGALTEEQKSAAANAWVKRLAGAADEINDGNKAIVDLEKENVDIDGKLLDLQQSLIDNQIDVENMVKDAIVQQHQDAIDSRKDFKDSLEEANNNLIDGLRESLDQEKEVYETNENKEELKSLQQQLAIAQKSGAPLSKVQDLQKQVADKQQDLYFQERENSIDELENAAQKQVEALEEQISIMETTLDWLIKTGEIWTEVNSLIASSTPDKLIELITHNSPDFLASSGLGKEQTLLELGDKIGTYFANKEDPDATPTEITNEDHAEEEPKNPEPKKPESEPEPEPEPKKPEPKSEPEPKKPTPKKPTKKTDGLEVSENTEIETPVEEKPVNIDLQSEYTLELPKDLGDDIKPVDVEAVEPTDSIEIGDKKQEEEPKPPKKPKPREGTVVSEGKVITTTGSITGADEMSAFELFSRYPKAIQNVILKKISLKEIKKLTAKEFLERFGKFAKGGEVDYTGPAWVDGSKNEPEHIFNFEQMEALREHLLNNVDVTRQAVNGLANTVNDLPNANTYNSINNNNDNSGITIGTLDFHMEVKEISNDYDARKAGQEVINEIVNIARKSGTRSLSRR